MKTSLLLHFVPLLAGTVSLSAVTLPSSVVPHDQEYYTAPQRNFELIYTEKNLPFAREAAGVEASLLPLYEAQYGFAMDEPLYVGLISDYNQIANGFSTQWPNNRQINYDAGVLAVDYFSSTSWLKTLLYHETAHNFQTNAKDSAVSQGLHSVLGNGYLIIPWFTMPNIVESSFLLEGNAVLNESWHGNGGRLYSGRFKAATLQQAKAGLLTPERVYNDNYYFLYGSHFYTLGGYYQYFLAEHYGLDNVNAYWKVHSRPWGWPFLTNWATRRSVGVSFDDAFAQWNSQMRSEAAMMHDVEGPAVAQTQFFSPMNDDRDAIYFISNPTGRSFPELVTYRKADGKVTKTRGSYIAGKAVPLPGGGIATQGSAYTSPWRIYAGLYDEEAMIVNGTRSKVVEGYLHDGTPVYFDVPRSFDQPQLYVGESFYAQVNSSVYIDDNDNLYYFVQGTDKARTLYKNRTPLFTLKGYYGHVVGVDSRGAVYFIANTRYGSGLFRFSNGKVTRANTADTIFDARLIDDGHALAAVMGSDAYSFKKITLETIDEPPYDVRLFVENDPRYHTDTDRGLQEETSAVSLEHPYTSLTAMNYSRTEAFLGADSQAGVLFDLNVVFADPLTQNALSLYLLRNADEYTLGGVSYDNSQFFIQFGVSAYGVIDKPDLPPGIEDNRRDYGIIVQSALPFLAAGRYSGALRANYYQDYENNSREPLSAALDLKRSEQYGVSMFRNFLLSANPYVSTDRGDSAYGGEAAFDYGLPYEIYTGLSGQYSHSDADTSAESRGIKVTRDQIAKFAEGDPTTVVMPSVKASSYVKSAAKGSAGIKKVLNLAAYYFTFPVSLRREALFASYSRYAFEAFGTPVSTVYANEVDTGVVLDTYWFNRLPIPITLQYLYNDNTQLAERHTFLFSLGLSY